MNSKLSPPHTLPANVTFRYSDNGTFSQVRNIEFRKISGHSSLNSNAHGLFTASQNDLNLYYSQSDNHFEDRDSGFIRGLSTIWQGDLTVTKKLQKLQKINHQQDSYFQQYQTKLHQQLTQKCQSHFKACVYNEATSHQGQTMYENYQLCKCGCGKRIGNSFSLTTVLEQKCLSLGYTVLLYFQFLKNMGFCLFLICGIFVIYSFTMNVKGSYYLTHLSDDCSFYCKAIRVISDYNKDFPLQQTKTQAILGIVSMFFLWIYINYLFYSQRRQKIQLTRQYQSPSDYVIAVDNYPSSQKTQKDLLRVLDYYCQLLLHRQEDIIEDYNKNHYKYYDLQSHGEEVHPLKRSDFDLIAVHMVYNMEQHRNRVHSLKAKCLALQQNIEISGEKAIIPVNFRQQYQYQKKDILNKYKILLKQREQFLSSSQNRKRLSTKRFFLQYKHSGQGKFAKDMALFQYGGVQYTLFQKFFKKGQYLQVDGRKLLITRASQPKNILWQNCQRDLTYKKVITNYLLIILFIIISIFVIQCLTILQNILKTNKNTSSTIWSIIIGFFLKVINSIAWKYFDKKTKDQEMYSHTEYLLSKITKISIFTFLNITLVPLIVTYIGNTKFYSTDGINGVVLTYHLTWIITETVGFISPKVLIFKMGLGIPSIRKIIIKKKYGILSDQIVNSPQFIKTVCQDFYDYPIIDIVQSLGQILINILQAFFFCSLQPILIPLVFLQTFIVYSYSKIKLLRYSQIQNFLDFLLVRYSIAISRMIPIAYGLGSIILQSIQFSSLSNRNNVNNNSFYIASIIFGFLIFINPFEINQKLFDCIFDKFYNQTVRKHYGYSSEMDQNYYKVSTSLDLVGFQEILAGKRPIRGEKDLKNCYQMSLKKCREQLFLQNRNKQSSIERVSIQ